MSWDEIDQKESIREGKETEKEKERGCKGRGCMYEQDQNKQNRNDERKKAASA